jgi:hypothetical protein
MVGKSAPIRTWDTRDIAKISGPSYVGGEAEVTYKGTPNVVQGKTGTERWRLTPAQLDFSLFEGDLVSLLDDVSDLACVRPRKDFFEIVTMFNLSDCELENFKCDTNIEDPISQEFTLLWNREAPVHHMPPDSPLESLTDIAGEAVKQFEDSGP